MLESLQGKFQSIVFAWHAPWPFYFFVVSDRIKVYRREEKRTRRSRRDEAEGEDDTDEANDGVSMPVDIPDRSASALERFVPQVATAAMANAVSVATKTTKSQMATLMWSGGTTGVACKLVSANVTWREVSVLVVDILLFEKSPCYRNAHKKRKLKNKRDKRQRSSPPNHRSAHTTPSFRVVKLDAGCHRCELWQKK